MIPGTSTNLEIARNKARSWRALHFLDLADGSALAESPLRLGLGRLTRTGYAADVAGARLCAEEWHKVDDEDVVEVIWSELLTHGIRIPYATAVVIRTPEELNWFLGGPDKTLERARERYVTLTERYGSQRTELRRILRRVTDMSDGDWQALLKACDWFSENDDHMTARQVPLALVHAKWVERHVGIITSIIGHTPKLLPRRRQIQLHWLDSAWLASSSREFDSYVISDVETPAYAPKIVLLVENKDCFDTFPKLDGLLCVWCEGNAHVCEDIANIEFISEAPRVLYWGDMDADGYALMDRLRRSGIIAESVAMDVETYEKFAKFGTNYDTSGKRIDVRRAADVIAACETLSADEQEAAELCVNGPVQRIEQERISYEHVIEQIRDTC